MASRRLARPDALAGGTSRINTDCVSGRQLQEGELGYEFSTSVDRAVLAQLEQCNLQADGFEFDRVSVASRHHTCGIECFKPVRKAILVAGRRSSWIRRCAVGLALHPRPVPRRHVGATP